MADFSVEDLKQRLRTQREATADAPLAEARRALDSVGARARLQTGVTVQSVCLASRNAERISPSGAAEGRIILYIHGGGFVAGSCASHRQLAAEIAMASNIETVTLDYGLAPENPWPAAEIDVCRAYRELLDSVSPDCIAVVGDSAGAHIAISALLRARDGNLPMPAAIALISPWIDLDLTGNSVADCAMADPVLRADRLKSYAVLYRNGERERNLLEADLSGFPPTLIQAGGDELLRDDSLRLVRRLEDQGVETVCEIGPGLFHVWHAYTPWLAEAREAVTRVGEFLKRRLKCQ